MSKVICDLSISVDEYSAGLDQSEDRPFGGDAGDGPLDLEQIESRASSGVTHITYRLLP